MILCLTGSSCQAAPKPKPKKHVIGCMPYGLFVNFGLVMSNLDWCVRTKVTPVVYWNEKCLYYTKDGYNGSLNAWEYYFEPVSSATYQDEAIHAKYADPEGLFMSITFEPHNQPTKATRKKVYETVIRPFIKLNPLVQEKVDAFFDEHMRGKHTIGIHLRGTDKYKDIKLVDPRLILEEAQRHAGPETQFFIATDEQALLELAITMLDGAVIAYDSHRSLDGKPLHHDGIYPPHLLGEEVVIEAWLLARCNLMVHTDRSNVSGAVLFLNPELDNVMLIAA